MHNSGADVHNITRIHALQAMDNKSYKQMITEGLEIIFEDYPDLLDDLKNIHVKFTRNSL